MAIGARSDRTAIAGQVELVRHVFARQRADVRVTCGCDSENHSRAILRLMVGGSAGVVWRGRGLVVTWIRCIALFLSLAGAASTIPRAGRASHRRDRQSDALFGRVPGSTRRAGSRNRHRRGDWRLRWCRRPGGAGIVVAR